MTLTSAPFSDSPQLRRLIAIGGVLLFLSVLVRTAWLDDDAYITFRTVDNLLHGFGPRWNVLNRVQAYTHPLWMLAMTVMAALTGEVYFAALILSAGMTLVVVWLIASRVAASAGLAVLALAMLVLSKAFVDYSTSGLENPLTHLLLVLFVLVLASSLPEPRRLGAATLVTSLLMVNRVDTGVLVLPALVALGWKVGPARGWRAVAFGLVPFIAWEAFALFYYGFPFPNTAYSKLAHEVARPELLFQGMLYVLDGASNQPLTLVVIAAALARVAVVPRDFALPLGILLYLAYVVWVGGDFMSGRFFTGPFLMAVMLLTSSPTGHGAAGAPRDRVPVGYLLSLGLVLFIGLTTPRPTIASDASYGADIERADAIAATGITDERRYYYPQSGLLTARRGVPMPNHKWYYMGLDARAGGRQVLTTDAAGFIGYAAGPEVYFVDKYGLGDPLIARLPATAPWRMGHFERNVPRGYLETLSSGRNQIADLGVAAYYEKLKIVTQDPLWSGRRLRTILAFNFGRFEHLVEEYELVRLPIDALAAVRPAGIDWNAAGTTTMSPRGVEVTFEPRRGGHLEFSVSADDRYAVRFLRQGTVVARTMTHPVEPTGSSLALRVVAAPEGEYDAVRIVPSWGDGRYSLGHVRWLP